MATMVKEKRKEKKKPKEKSTSKSDRISEERFKSVEFEINADATFANENANTALGIQTNIHQDFLEPCEEVSCSNVTPHDPIDINPITKSPPEPVDISMQDTNLKEKSVISPAESITIKTSENNNLVKSRIEAKESDVLSSSYKHLSTKLERMFIPNLNSNMPLDEIQDRLENPRAYLRMEEEKKVVSSEECRVNEEQVENAVPSAPVFEEISHVLQPREEVQIRERSTSKAAPKLQCMPIEEAMRLFGEKEIADVRAMSEREEAIVEAGPVSGPEHPLVDLLSTFRTSLRAVERERMQLSKTFTEEEKFRNALWKVEKRNIHVSEDCPCGASVVLKASYEHAELMKERLPVAKLKLEGILRDVQDSYCHHQHSALLAHCQIEELISETMKSNKNEIREALALILQCLRMSDNAPSALAIALQRWAAALSSALLDGRDIRQLLYLLHHLFRQSWSVRWAAKLIHLTAGDRSSAAQVVALLDLLLARQRLEPAVECTEDADASWEEVDDRGGGCAVSEGALREHDLLAILHAMPIRELVARIVLFTHSDIKNAREYEWGDPSGGSGVLKACCGVRTLLAVLQRGAESHPHYTRLHQEIRNVAARVLHALAGLHLHVRHNYIRSLEARISVEMEAAFSAGFNIMGVNNLHTLPATLLADITAKEYCLAFIIGLHDLSPKQLATLSLQAAVLPCDVTVRVVTQAAVDRVYDNELARIVLEFLFQTGIKKKTVQCKGTCDVTARNQLASLLAVHPYLHTTALHILADLNHVEPLDPSSVDPLTPHAWRPEPTELRALLDDWAIRCPALIQHLLIKLDYTPHTGISLPTQLAIGRWLCGYFRQVPPPEWSWSVLRRLCVHRSSWSMSLDAPPPDPEPGDLLSSAFAVLSSSWGHCIPLICSEGISALLLLSSTRVQDAVHCLGPVMLVMAHSPESISVTPKFAELFSVLVKSGPSMVQRALGLGPVPGAELLTTLILKQLEGDFAGIPRSCILSAWLHALWRLSLSAASSQLETALLATRDWQLFDSYATMLLQDKNSSEYVTSAVRNAHIAPLVCECVLRSSAHLEARTITARLLDVLHLQRTAGDRIHVDNALKQIGASVSSDQLVVYRSAAALLVCPLSHPSHLMLWRLFTHVYLQRPPSRMHDTTPPVGPLFYSGIIKSRLLAQLRKKLLETIQYHHNEAELLKQKNVEDPQPPSRRKREQSTPTEEGIVPMLSIEDFTGESSESDDSVEEEMEIERVSNKEEKKKDTEDLLKYHTSAEIMCKEFQRWFEEGDKTRAMPLHADVERFIPQHALAAAWKLELSRRRPTSLDESPINITTSQPVSHLTTPFQNTVAALLNIEECDNKSHKVTIKSVLDGAELRDARSILAVVDKHLADIEMLVQEWSAEVSRISSLDGALWDLVTSLRVRRPLPPVKKQCANKCKPVTIHIPHQEWCISTGAERGIRENRRSALSLIRRLARPRPHAARSAAALIAVVRYIGSTEAAVRAAERAWRCAGTVQEAPPAHAALTALVQLLADLWISKDGKLCSELLSRWCSTSSSSLQQTLCGCVVRPHSSHWPDAYCAILRGRLPSHTAFSYLSKFELSRWSVSLESTVRHELLEALFKAAQKWGLKPDPDHHVLLELIGVHTALLTNDQELCAHITRCARASVQCTLPPTYWTHVTRAAEIHARSVPFDQLGHLLRSLGVIWWEARTTSNTTRMSQHALYANHVALLLRTLQRAFVAAAVALSYAAERVSLYAWSSLLESWSPWVSPSPSAAPLLPSTNSSEQQYYHYTDMIKHFIDNVHQIMLDCPRSEESLLQHVFDWSVNTYLGTKTATDQECRVQMSALLEQLRALPWTEHQWIRSAGVQVALQVCASNEREIQSWCADAWRAVTSEGWLSDVTGQQLAPLLASLLYLFTAMTQHEQTLEEACRLPWHRLPEAALEEGLDRFFAQYHNPTLPYHDLPQFKIILHASELSVNPLYGPVHTLARNKRGMAISRWLRSATVPTLLEHVPRHCAAVLAALSDVEPHLRSSEGEIEELMTRAVVIMCMEPAATAALPVWVNWVSSAALPMRCACVSASIALTAFEYFTSLGEAAVMALMTHQDSPGWPYVRSRWLSSHWREVAPMIARTRLHAAYAVSIAHPQSHTALTTACLALLHADINYIEQDVIVALWICLLCRVSLIGDGDEAVETRAAATGVLNKWAGEGRRSLLKVVTLQHDTAVHTDRHRLLSRLAVCILNNCDVTTRAYEAACASLLGPTSDTMTWGKSPHPKRLPRLAMRLYPNYGIYFQYELDLAPNE